MGIPDSACRADVSRTPASARGSGSVEPLEPDVRVYCCDTRAIDLAQYRALVRLLSPDERRRADALWRADDRRDFVAAHALLRHTLTLTTGLAPEQLTFERDANGKPFLVGAGKASPGFSLSHSRDLVACVISRTRAAGIDVEAVNRSIDVRRIAARYFSAAEAAALQRCPAEERPSRFCELWTLKEAWLKAAGLGLASLDCVSFLVDGGQASLAFAPPSVATDWAFTLMDVGRSHKLAVAIGFRRSHPRVTHLAPAALVEALLAHISGADPARHDVRRSP